MRLAKSTAPVAATYTILFAAKLSAFNAITTGRNGTLDKLHFFYFNHGFHLGGIRSEKLPVT